MLLLNQLKSTFDRSGDDRPVSDLDDRPLQEPGMLDHQFYQAFRIGVRRKAEILRDGFVTAKNVPRLQPGFRDQSV